MKDVTSMDKQDIMKKAYEIGFAYERDLGNCPQCVLATMQDLFDIGGEELLFNAATPFAGGGGRSTNGTCGALVGGMMTLGIIFGRNRREWESKIVKDRAFTSAKELHDKFMEEYGGILCREIQQKIMGRSFDLTKKEDFDAFLNAGGHSDKCPDVVGKAARWTAEIIMEDLGS
ncbi:MAG: C_GCAxxG_C_C family protein [Theionarchaea archaeon]|nr:C_GCAxxG_C_C family protein [Theionarchaea archaeon]